MLILNPVDYLSPVLVRDEILGIRPTGKSGGHDNWGFTNVRVPETVEIVTLGDSHSYGNTAKLNEAWPKVLARLTGKNVYNLAMGGCGPNQYYYLLQTNNDHAISQIAAWYHCSMTTQAWGGLSSETIRIRLARPIDLALAAAPDVAAAVIALRRHVGVHIPFEGGPHQENKDIGTR